MSKVQEILANKGSTVYQIDQSATVFDAAVRMNEYKIGALVVVENGRVVGIITERDVLSRVVAEKRAADKTPVASVMSTQVACSRPTMSIDEARTIMRDRKIRHLPVVDDEDQLLGMISIGDLNAYRLDGQAQTIHYMTEYIYGQT